MIDPPDKIGARLLALRKSLDVSQTKIAEDLGITQPQWNQYERGNRRLTIEVAGMMVSSYGVTLDWLYLGDTSGLPLRLEPLSKMK